MAYMPVVDMRTLVVVDAGHELFAGEAKSTADQAAVGWFRRYLLD
jgi:hypothetical protein